MLNPFSKRIVLGLAVLAGATWSDAAEIKGRIIDEESRLPLQGVQVVLSSRPGQKAITDAQGRYRFTDVPEGAVVVNANFLGYTEAERSLELPAGTSEIDLVLRSGLRDLGSARVQGQASGQVKALNDQRNASDIRNVIASDQIGRFPDQNAAEAIARAPGVSVARDQGEGRYVLVRGTKPGLTSVKINGQDVPSPEGDIRAVALDVIPSGQVGSIELHKSLLPEMDADAIGGQVDLRTRVARSATPEFGVSVAGAYNQEMESFRNFEGGLTYAQRFGKLGVAAGGSFSTRHQGSDNIELSYGEMPVFLHPDSVDAEGELVETDESVEGVESIELRDYEIVRRRASLNLGLDYELGRGSRLWASAWYNMFSDQEYRRLLSMDFSEGKIFASNPNVATDAEATRELKDRYEEQHIWSVAVGAEHAIGAAKLDYSASYSHAGEDTPDRQETVYKGEFSAEVPKAGSDFPQVAVTDGDVTNIANFEFDEAVTGDDKTTDENIVAALNFQFPVATSLGLKAKTGAKMRMKHKERDDQETKWSFLDEDENGNEIDVPTLDAVESSFKDKDFLKGKYKSLLGLFPDADKVRDLLEKNSSAFESEEDLADNVLSDYDAKEQVYAGYLQLHWDRGPWSAIVGARLEQTNLESEGYGVDAEAETSAKIKEKNDYMHVLPGAHVRYALGARTNLRAAAWRSLARPDYYDLVPYVLTEDDEVEMGNPALEASEATNFDFMAEHYFGGLGMVSAGYFFKWIEQDIFTTMRESEGMKITMPINGDWAQIHGMELNYSQQLLFLPGIAKSFALYGNYTYAWSEAEVPGRSDLIRMPGQSEHMANVSISFERWGFSTRLSYNMHGDYLSEVGESSEEDVWYDSRTQLDWSASQELFDGFFVFVELSNLLDEPLRYYQGDDNKPVQIEYYGIMTLAGIKYSF